MNSVGGLPVGGVADVVLNMPPDQGAPSGTLAVAPSDTDDAPSSYCCSSRCVQHVGTAIGSVLLIIGVAAIIFGCVSAFNPVIITAGSLLAFGGITVIFLAQKYIGLDVEIQKFKAQNKILQAANSQYLGLNQQHEALIRQQGTSIRQLEDSVAEQLASVEALRSTEVLTKQNLAQLEGILAGVVQSSATERAAAAAQIQGLRDTIGYLNDAVTSSLAGHKAGLAESAAGVNAAVNRLSTTAESVNGAIQRLLEAVHTLDQSSCLFKAKERELQELKAENAKLKAQLASNQRGSTVSSANAALPLSANAASGPTKATTQPVTSFAAGVGSSGSFFPS